MKLRKIMAGMTAAVILATSTVSAFAEVPSYDLPLLTAVDGSGILAALNAGDSFRLSVTKLLGDRAGDLAKVVISLDGEGTGSINWAGAGETPQDFAAADGDITLENTMFVSDNGFDGIEVNVSADSVNLNSIEFFDKNDNSLFVYSADSFSNFTESTVLLDQPVAIDNWDMGAAVSARTLREAGTAIAGTSYLKVDFSQVSEENGGCMFAVLGLGDEWRWSYYDGAGSCYVAVTENMLIGGIRAQAVNTQIDKITVVNPADVQPVANEYTYSSTLFEGSTTLDTPENGDATNIVIDPVGAKAGDIISVAIDTAQMNNGGVYFMDGSYNDLADARFGKNWLEVSGNLDSVEFMLDEQGAKQLNSRGLIVGGSGNIPVTKVELFSKSAIGAADTPLAELYCDPGSMQEGDQYPYYALRLEQYLGDRISDVATVDVYVDSDSETIEGAVGWGDWDSITYAEDTFTSTGAWQVTPTFEKGKNHNLLIEDRDGHMIIEKIVVKDSSDNVLLEFVPNFFNGYVSSGSLDVSGAIDFNNSTAISARDLSAIQDLKAGVSFLEITVESTGGSIYASNVGNWDFSAEWFDTKNEPGRNKYYRVITQDMLDMGVMINGDSAVSITSVNVINPAGEEFSPKEYPVHEMLVREPIECIEWENENGDMESTNVFLPLINAQAGDILRFNINITNPDDFFASVKDANEWNGLSSKILDEYGGVNLIPSLNSFDVQIAESDLDKLRYFGAVFGAKGLTLESVELLGQEGTSLVRNLANLYCDPAEMGEGDEYPRYWFHPEQYVDDITDVATIEVYTDSDSDAFVGAIGWGEWDNITYAEDTFTTKGAWQVTPTLEKGKNHNLVIEDRNGHILIERIVMKDAEGGVIFEYAPDSFDGYEAGGSLNVSGAVDWNGSIAVSAKDLSAIEKLKAGVSFLELTVESEGGVIYATTVGNYEFDNERFDTNNEPNRNKYYRIITQEMLDRGIVINGDKTTITSARIINPKGETFTPVNYAVQETLVNGPIECVEFEDENGKMVFTDVYISPLNVQAGDILRFNISVTNADDYCAFVHNAKDYTALSDSNRIDECGCVELAQGLNSFDIHIGASDIDLIRNYGVILSAKGMTLNSVELLGQEGAGSVPVIAAFNENDDGEKQIEIKPFKYIDNYTDIARVEVAVSGNGGGMLAFNDYENWINARGENEAAFNAGSETWVFDNISCNKEFSIHIQAWWGNVYVESVTFKDSNGNVLFTLTSENYVYPFVELSKGDTYDIHTAELLGDSLSDVAYAKIECVGEGTVSLMWNGTDNVYMMDYSEGAGYLPLTNFDASNPLMTICGKDGTVGIRSVSFADDSMNELFTLNYTNEYLNVEYVEPIATLVSEERYLIYPELLLGDDFDKLYSVEIETSGRGNGSLGWQVYDPAKEGEDYPFTWTDTGRCEAGETWVSGELELTKGESGIYFERWGGNVNVLSITFKDAEGKVIATYTAENMPKTFADLSSEGTSAYEIYAKNLLGDDFDKVAKITASTFGQGGGGLVWGEGEEDCAGDGVGKIWTADVSGGIPETISINVWWGNVQLVNVVFYDAEGNVLFTLDNDTAYLNIDGTILANLQSYMNENGEKQDKNFYFNPKAILGSKYSDLAYIKLNGKGTADFAFSGEDGFIFRTLPFSSDEFGAVTPNNDYPVIIVWSSDDPTILTSVEFYDSEMSLIGTLTSENMGANVVATDNSLAVIGNAYDGQISNVYPLCIDSILGSDVDKLATIEATIFGKGAGAIQWDNSTNGWCAGDYAETEIWSANNPSFDSYNRKANVMAYWGLNYVESVTFKDAQGKVLATLTPENAAKLNVPRDVRDGGVSFEGNFDLTDEWSHDWLMTSPVQSEEGDILRVYLTAYEGEEDTCIVITDTAWRRFGNDEMEDAVFHFENGEAVAEFKLSAQAVQYIAENGIAINGINAIIKKVEFANPVTNVQNVTAAAGDKQVTLTWDALPGATKYAVCTYANGKYTVLANNITDTTYTATNLTNGTEYQFLVQAYVNGAWTKASTDYLVKATPVAPASTKPVVKAVAGDSTVTLSWEPVEGATKYAVSVLNSSGKLSVLTSTLTNTTYTINALDNGTTYKFLVQAYVNGAWTKYAGAEDLVEATPVGVAKPFPTAVAGDGSVTLSWDEVEGATKYAVCLYNNGKYKVLNNSILKTSFTVTGLANGTEYKFLVQAYVNGAWNEFTNDDLVSCTPVGSTKPMVQATAGDNSAKLSWTPVNGATKYAVSLYNNGKYTTYTNSLTATEYTVSNLTNGTEYKFLVQAYVNGAWSKFTLDDLVSCTPVGSSKPVVSTVGGDNSVTLSWDAVSGATKYAVSLYNNGKYITYTNNLTATEYTVTGLANGTTYKFLVQAYVNGAWSKFTLDDLAEGTPVGSTKPVVFTEGKDNAVTLTWNPVSSATKYAVSLYNNGKYTTYTNTLTATEYTVTGLTNGTTYKFLVQAYVNGTWSKFTLDDLVEETPVGSAKPIVFAEGGDNSVTLSWNPVDKATKYAVSLYNNGRYTTYTNTLTATEYTVTGLANGTTYKFLVQAYVNGTWSKFTADDLVDGTPEGSAKPVVTASGIDGAVELSWSPVSGATKYAVSLYNGKKFISYTLDLEDTEYVVDGLINGNTYKFLVQAYVGGKWSAFTMDDLVEATPKGSSKPFVTVEPGDESATLSWMPVDGATKYAVSLYNNGKFTTYTTSWTETEYTVYGLSNGTTYQFLVQAFVNGTWTTFTTDDLVSVVPQA